MHCAATEQSSEHPVYGQAVSFCLAILFKIQKYPPSIFHGFHLYLWSILKMRVGRFAILVNNIAHPNSRTGKCLPVHTDEIQQMLNFAVF